MRYLSRRGGRPPGGLCDAADSQKLRKKSKEWIFRKRSTALTKTVIFALSLITVLWGLPVAASIPSSSSAAADEEPSSSSRTAAEAEVEASPLPWFPVHLYQQQGWLQAVRTM